MKERLINADSLLEFFDSPTSGIDEVLQDCIIKHGFTYENNFNEEKAIDLCREVIDKVKNVIYTEPVITEMDLIYGWHNLIENPEDLPKDINRNAYYDWLLLELDCGKYYTGWFRSDDKEFYIEDGCGGRFTNRVIKWREIEKFEVEE